MAKAQLTPEEYETQQTEAMKARYLKAVPAAGAADGFDAEYDGDPADLDGFDAPTPRAFDPDADEIDLDIDGRARVVNLTSKTREALRFEIPALTVDKLDRIEWYLGRYNNRTQEMHKARDEQSADKFGAQRRRVQEQMIAYIVPDWPLGTTARMPVKAFNEMWALINSMSREAVAGATTQAQTSDDPNF